MIRTEAEAAALAEVAMDAGVTPDDLRDLLDRIRGAPPLDAEGLPFAPCRVCLGRDFWKPAALPIEGEGWRCAACVPPPKAGGRHACSVPAGRAP
ncbi:hypothetical protein [Rhodobaculum claviforme]|uniref:Uncharacterized protein n=1 Tax=Rhodobaculum claviforme TaxID=1549854 RepID=A0A934WJI9_9RHOB|nr:hypothetical protein [Rhodobaculum claviforme]MBK5927992.1 hypothetical protein [Rhodobaculum claviforme]